MDLGIAGKVALVGGASSGLGLAIARELAKEGVAVAMMARGAERLGAEAERIRSSGGRAIAVPGDVTSAADVEQLVAKVVAELGPIEILVANAGGPPSTTFADSTEAQYRSAIEINLLGSIRLAQACVPGMRQRKWGRVIFLTSMAAKQPLAGLLLSNTARAGLLGFAKTIAAECAPDNVLVNTILPGHFDTPRAVELAEMRAQREKKSMDDLIRARTASIPVGRIGKPEELAAAVVFLASERASFITGTAIQVDGGQIGSLI